MRAVIVIALLLAALGGYGCGEEAESADGPTHAREGNDIVLGGVAYRVTLFRQINPRIVPGRAIYDGPLPAGEEGIYAAFLVVCNRSDTERTPTDRIHLEDAFGEVFRPVELEPDNRLAYRPEPLGPGDCLPPEDSVADRTLSGAAVVFRVPFDDVRERPMILSIDPPDDGAPAVHVELDL